MRTRQSRPRGFDGGTLRLRLLALVTVPLVGLASAAWLQIQPRISSERAAGHAENAIRVVGTIDAARADFQQEILPSLVVAIIRNPSAVPTLPQPSPETARATIAQLTALRATTDLAVLKAAGKATVGSGPGELSGQVAQLRQQLGDPARFVQGFAAALGLVNSLANAENLQITKALSAGLAPAGVQALNDVDLVARACQTASVELPLFASVVLLPPGKDADITRLRWVQAWAAFDNASNTVASRGGVDIRAAWQVANSSPAIAGFNQFLATQLSPQVSTSSASGLTTTLALELTRNQAYRGVLSTTVTQALAAGASQRVSAQSDLKMIIIGCLLLLLLSWGVVFLVRKSVSSPLQELAQQAVRISEGELTDVNVRGPREVRTVARALAGSVASLRNIEAQATAVAAGDLDSPVVSQPLPGPLGEVVHSSVIRIVSAIHEREEAQRDLAHQAAHDALTDLPNRAQALINIRQGLHRAQRSAAMTALMFVDLDYFKAVNDTFGHAAGDEVLQEVAKRMLTAVRDGDTVARLGGDEFVILLEDVSNEGDIVKLAERIVNDVSCPITLDQRVVRVGASVGIAFCRDGYVDADRLLSEADAAAYRAKGAGRGRVDVFDDDLRSALKLRERLETAISDALIKDEFVLHYQPVIDLKSGRPCGVEALIRWNRPGFGLVAPDEFIPMAEGSSLINDIGRWALLQAATQLAKWEQTQPATGSLTMAVNISGRHMASGQLITDVRDALAASGIAPHRLTLELTETVLVEDPVATRNMKTLRALGVRIAIDDFGTGYTSIGQLPKLPVDTLKIDRSFIASPDPAHRELVKLIVSAAHAFGLSVVAEGVEHAYQVDEMRDVDVDTAQGFFFARPLPIGALLDSALLEIIESTSVVALPTVA